MSIFEEFEVKQVSASLGKAFIIERHYTKGIMNSPKCIGLFHKGILRACIAYACPISENVRSCVFGAEHKDNVTELHRMVAMQDDEWQERPKNLLSWFIPRAHNALLEIKPNIRAIVSFADSTQDHVGSVYRATNALYFGTVRNNGISYLDQEGRLRSHRQNGVNLTEQQCLDKGWIKVIRKCKHKYAWIVAPTKRELKKWRSNLLLTPITWK
jgi:hypothetical protein